MEISVKQNLDIYEIKFGYDPNFIAMLKTIPGHRWNPVDKLWSLPIDKLGTLIELCKGTRYHLNIFSQEHINENQEMPKTISVPEYPLPKIYIKEGHTLYQHQKDFLRYAIHRQEVLHNYSGFIVADQPGLGKSLESIELAMYNKDTHNFKHCLVLCCVNSSKFNWQKEIEDNTQSGGYILGTKVSKTGRVSYGGGKEKYKDLKRIDELPYFIILNVEALRYKEERNYVITEELIKIINSGKLNMIIIDEVHKNLSPTSQQGKQLLKIKNKCAKPVLWLPMSGTIINNKPTDLFLALKLINAHDFKNYYAFNQYFCVFGGYGGYQIIAYKNLDRLKDMLQKNMIRRLKEDVLDLPEKVFIDEIVYNTNTQQRLIDEYKRELLLHTAEIASSVNPLTKLLTLRQINDAPELVDDTIKVDKLYIAKNAKLQRTLDLCEEIIEAGEKVVIFSIWIEPLRMLYQYLSSQGYKLTYFTGTMKSEDREQQKQLFMNNPEYKIMLGTVGALGTTHTLTSANHIIFYNEPWTYTDKLQAMDRIHRISQTNTCFIHTLLSKDTVDERVHDIVYVKKGIADFMVDNKIDFHNEDLIRSLIR